MSTHVDPATSAHVESDGWESLPKAATDYRSIILSQELTEGDGAGSRLIIQEGIPSSQTAAEHRDNRVLDLRSQGVDAAELDDRTISGSQASGLSYVNSDRIIHTWYVVADELRYTINLESAEGEDLSQQAIGVLDDIVLGG